MEKEDRTQLPTHIVGDMGIALTRFKCGRMGLLFREKPTLDFGIDGEIEIMISGVATGRLIGVQVKCGKSYLRHQNPEGFDFSFEAKHYEYWRNHALPTIGVLVDPDNEICYWGILSEATISKTGSLYKTTIPSTQVLSEEFRDHLIRLATPAIPDSTFEVFNEEDPSTGFARRVSTYVRLNASDKPWTRESIRRLILQLTSESRSSQYYRSAESAAAHEQKPADVVWVYVYRSETDRSLGAYLARSIWVDKNLPKEHHPIGFNGDADSSGIRIEWNDNFRDIVKIIDERRSSKAEYIQYALSILGNVEPIFKKYHYQAPIEGSAFNYAHYSTEYESLKPEFSEPLVPPRECERLDVALGAMMGLLDNANTFVGRAATEQKERDLVQFKRSLSDAYKKFEASHYELELVRV